MNMNISIKSIGGKRVIASTEVAKIFGKDHNDIIRAIGNLTLVAPEVANYFQLVDGNEYVMEKDGFMVLTSSIPGQNAFMIKMEVVKALEEKHTDSLLTVIEEREVLGKDFRIYGTTDAPLFLAKDVAEWIDYSKTGNGRYDVSRMLKTVDEDEKGTKTVRTPGGPQTMWFLTEDGLYEVLMQSRKPIAKAFKKEVKKILKTIRKTGAYIAPEAKPINTAGQIQMMLQQNMQMVSIMQKQTDMMNCMGKLMARSVDALSKLANEVCRVNSTDDLSAPKQIDLLGAPKKAVAPRGSMTLKAAAASFGFYAIKTGRPNVSLIADILKYGCGIRLQAKFGYEDEYQIITEVQSGDSVVPCIWLKEKAVESLRKYLSSNAMNAIVHSTTYKKKYKESAAGDWKYDYIQYVGKKCHILASNDGSRKKYEKAA